MVILLPLPTLCIVKTSNEAVPVRTDNSGVDQTTANRLDCYVRLVHSIHIARFIYHFVKMTSFSLSDKPPQSLNPVANCGILTYFLCKVKHILIDSLE